MAAVEVGCQSESRRGNTGQLLAVVEPAPTLVTVQLTVIGWPEKSCGGACTLVVARSAGGLRLTVKAPLIATLSARVNSGIAKGKA